MMPVNFISRYMQKDVPAEALICLCRITVEHVCSDFGPCNNKLIDSFILVLTCQHEDCYDALDSIVE